MLCRSRRMPVRWMPLGILLTGCVAVGQPQPVIGVTADTRVSTERARPAARTVVGPDLRAAELRGCWLTHYAFQNKTDAQLRAIAQNILAGHMNTVYVCVYGGGTVHWPSKAYQAAGGTWASPNFDAVRRLVRIFHEEGLKVGAFFEYGMALGPAGHPIAVAHPEWLARDIHGDPVTGENGGFVFLSPGHPDAMNLLVSMIRELAENYSFDDIQLDRFRWGRKTTGREYGYETATADLYRAAYGTDPPTNVNNSRWVEFREGLVNQAVQQCYEAVKAANPEIAVSSAPVGSYGITQHMQRWSAWVEGGYMDLVMPQMYVTSLSAFINEFNTQVAQAPDHLDKLAVGYRASEDDDYLVVTDQLNYARGQGIPHGGLWVYHQYTSQIAIQDEIDYLPQPGQSWELPAGNPFVSDRAVQLVVDNLDGATAYQEAGTWINSAQPDYFQFDSRVIAGGDAGYARFRTATPKTGRYDVYVWYTASSNRNDQAEYTVWHGNGSSTVYLDQRSNGGRWVHLGRWPFWAGPITHRVRVSNAGAEPGEYTSSDAMKLVLSGYALGEVNGDNRVTAADYALAGDCWTGPGAGPVSGICEAMDFDDDTDVDLADFARFQEVLIP